jgi:hypothetical protein
VQITKLPNQKESIDASKLKKSGASVKSGDGSKKEQAPKNAVVVVNRNINVLSTKSS